MRIEKNKPSLKTTILALSLVISCVGLFGTSVGAVSVPLAHDPAGTADAADYVGGPSFSGTGGDTVSDRVNVFSLDLSSIGGGTCGISDITSVTLTATYTRNEPTGDGIAADDGGAIAVGDPADLTAWGTVSSPLGTAGSAALLYEWALRDFTSLNGQVSNSGVPIGGTWSSATPPTILKVMVLALTGGEKGESTSITQPAADVTFSPTSSCASPSLATDPDISTTPASTPVTINVLGNDTGTGFSVSKIDGQDVVAGQTITLTNGSGTVTLNNDGTITFTPAAGFTGESMFSYSITDGASTVDTGVVRITVAAGPTLAQTGFDQTQLLSLATLLCLMGLMGLKIMSKPATITR